MRILLAGLCAVAAIAGDVLPARAAWNNVFQPTAFGRCRQKQQPATARYTPAVVYSAPVVAASPTCNTCQQAPQSNCSTSYTQRCYYQPVTSYVSQSYYEPVTTYSTSYYYEPVTSYRYSCYYDPCTCSTQQVATPVTSYQLRAQSCPVQSWVQRCAQVPVTTYQKSCYWQPQTTCCQTTMGAPVLTSGSPVVSAPVVAAPAVTAPVVPQPQYQAPISAPAAVNPPPSVQAQPSTPPPPVVNENRAPTGSGYDRYYPQPQPQQQQQPQQNQSNTQTPGTSWQPAQVVSPVPSQPRLIPPSTPAVKLERIVFGSDATVEGQVVRSDNSPRADARILFVSVDQPNRREQVTSNGAGRFQVGLASGGWMVYLQNPDGNAVFHSRIDVHDQAARIVLVNR